MDNFQFTQVNDQIIRDASEDWLNEVGNDLFQVEYERYFNETLLRSQDVFYAIGIKGNPVVLAFVEIISKHRVAKAKLLRITVHPSLLPLDADGNQETLVNVYLYAVKNTFHLAATNEAREVKIYGRTDHMLNVLKTVSSILDESPMAGFVHILENRWLSFYATKE